LYRLLCTGGIILGFLLFVVARLDSFIPEKTKSLADRQTSRLKKENMSTLANGAIIDIDRQRLSPQFTITLNFEIFLGFCSGYISNLQVPAVHWESPSNIATKISNLYSSTAFA